MMTAVELAGSHNGWSFPWCENTVLEAGTCVPAIVRYHPRAQVKKNQTFKHIAKPNRLDPIIGSLVNVTIPQSKAPDSQNHLWICGWLESKRSSLLSRNLIFLALSVRKRKWKYIEPSNGSPMITWGPKIETGYAPFMISCSI